jgi:F-type H+-transporting ATPase subunit alpha
VPHTLITISDASTRFLLARGSRLTQLLTQAQYTPMATEVMAPILYAGINGLLDKVPVDKIREWETSFIKHLTSQQQDLLAESSKGIMTKDLEAQYKSVVEAHVADFL